MMDKPDVDHIEGLSPAIAIEQKATSHNPRSTVGTVTEIYDYLRLLFARAGTAALPRPRHRPGGADRQPDGRPGAAGRRRTSAALLLAPLVTDRKGEHAQVLADLRRPGFRARAHRRHGARARRPAGARCRGASTPSRRWSTASGCAPDIAQRLAESFETALQARRRQCARAYSTDEPAPGAAAVLEPPRLPGLRLQRCRTRAAAVLVQQSGRRLPGLRRPRACSSSSTRSAWWRIRSCRWPAARSAAGTGATPTTSR